MVQGFSDGARSLLRNSPNCAISGNWVFQDFILADEPLAKALRIFEACVLVKNNLFAKLVSWLESTTAFDESFRVTWVSFFYPEF